MCVVEWARFNLKADVSEAQLIEAAVAMQKSFLSLQPGYRSRRLVILGPGCYADIVECQTHEAASAAMSRASDFPVCTDYFRLMLVDQQPMLGRELFSHAHGEQLAQGLEFSLFRLQPGVSEAELASAACVMASGLYSGEPGFQGHMVMRSAEDPGLYADVVLADSSERARMLCGKWGQPAFAPECHEYLAKIAPESVKLQFWQKIP